MLRETGTHQGALPGLQVTAKLPLVVESSGVTTHALRIAARPPTLQPTVQPKDQARVAANPLSH